MERQCVVFGCRNSATLFQTKKNDCNFFSFPLSRPELVDKWLKKLYLEGWTPGPENVVCEEHFSLDSFEMVNNKRTLKPEAIPSMIDDLQTIITNSESIFEEDIYDEDGVIDLRCRICAKYLSSKNAVYIYEANENVIGKMMACIPVLVKEEDTLPKHVCRVCLTDLNVSYRMLVRAIESEKLFNNLSKSQEKSDQNECEVMKSDRTEKEARTVCVICDLDFEDINDLSVHFQKAHVDQLAMAEEKNRNEGDDLMNFIDIDSVKLEVDAVAEQAVLPIKSLQSPAKWTCTVCKMTFASNDILSFHMENFHKSSEVTTLATRSGDRDHIYADMKQDSALLVCSFCSKLFNSIDTLNEHLEEHIGTDTGSTCGLECQDKEDMESHEEEQHHQKDRSNMCSICCTVFFTHADMVQHMKNEHCKSNGAKEESTSQKWKCNYCGKEIGTKLSLTIHERIHTGIRPYVCECCGRTFKSKANLIQHQPVHTGVKRYKCTICDKPFARKAFVTTHMRVHTGERPFKCEICGNRYTQIGDMRRHRKRHFIRPGISIREMTSIEVNNGEVVTLVNSNNNNALKAAADNDEDEDDHGDDAKLISIESSNVFENNGLVKLHFAKDVTDFRRILVELQQ